MRTQELKLGTTVIHVNEDIDMDVADELRSTIDEQISKGCKKIVIDMTGVVTVDSHGLATLRHACKALKRIGGRMSAFCAKANIVRVFEIVGLDVDVPIYDSLSDALAGLHD
jgi:anti-anti-sigma factor